MQSERKIEALLKRWFEDEGLGIRSNADLLAYKGRDGELRVSALARHLSDELSKGGMIHTAEEPSFTLRASDLLAPDLIDLWANRAKVSGLSFDKAQQAYELAERMRSWPDRSYPR